MVTGITLQSRQNVVTQIACAGSEGRLHYCLRGRRVINATKVVGLICSKLIKEYCNSYIKVYSLYLDCRNGSLRLIDGPAQWEGRLNVCSSGGWGTVCGDRWTEREAALVCSRLGYPEISRSTY